MRGETTVGRLLDEAAELFRRAEEPPDRRDAVLLLARELGRSEAFTRSHPEARVDGAVAERARRLFARRARGEPFAYLVGEREFWGRTFRVDPRVLVPRPETEHLVEAALALELPAEPRILDLGVGSGAIAWTLAAELPGARVVGVDVSLGALAVADGNRRALLGGRRDGVTGSDGASRDPAGSGRSAPAAAALVVGDLAGALVLDRFDLVVSNPPYLDRESPEVEAAVRRFEPAAALWAEDGGRAVLARLLDLGPRLRPGAWLLTEIGWDQRDWWLAAVAAREEWEAATVLEDLAGRPRVGRCRRAAGRPSREGR